MNRIARTVHELNAKVGANSLRKLVGVEVLQILEVRELLEVTRQANGVSIRSTCVEVGDIVELVDACDGDSRVTAVVDHGTRSRGNGTRALGDKLGMINDANEGALGLEATEHSLDIVRGSGERKGGDDERRTNSWLHA